MPTRSEEYEIVLRVRNEATKVLKEIGPEAMKAGREAQRSLGLVQRALRDVRQAASAVAGAIAAPFRAIGRGIARFVTPGIGQIVLLLASISGLTSAARGATQFADAMSQVATIVETTKEGLAELSEEVLAQSRAFGTNELEQAKGLYQTISAGITDAREATVFLGEATKLAVGGAATTAEAVDLLTNIVNAYGRGSEYAANASDVLFQTVRFGKTTVSELASGLSTAIPQAVNLGVTLEELGAAVATITASGRGTTGEAATQIASVLRQLQRNFDGVQTLLRGVGKDFDFTTIRARGLVPVLQDIRDAAGSDERIFEVLGARAEALNAILNLTGDQTARFNLNLERMGQAAGATGRALDQRLDTPAKRVSLTLNVLRQTLQQGLGNAFLEAADAAIQTAGGIDRVRQNASIAIGVVSEFVRSGVEGFGLLIARVNDYVDSIGGIERVTEVAAAGARFAAKALQVAFLEVADQVSTLVDVLKLLPYAVRSVLADLPVVGTRSKDAVQEVLDRQLDRLREQQNALRRARDEFSAALNDPKGSESGLFSESRIQKAGRLLDLALTKVSLVEGGIRELQQELAQAPEAPESIFAKLDKVLEGADRGRDTDKARRELAKLGKELADALAGGAEEQARGPGGIVEVLGRIAYEAATEAGKRAKDALEAGAGGLRLSGFTFDGLGTALADAVGRAGPEIQRARYEIEQSLSGLEVQAPSFVGFAAALAGAVSESAPAVQRALEEVGKNLELPPQQAPTQVSPLELARIREAQEFSLSLDSEIARTAEERIAIIGRELELRKEGIRLRGEELGLSAEEIDRLRGVAEVASQFKTDQVLGFKDAQDELSKALERVTLTQEEQTAVIAAAKEAELERIDTLEGLGKISEEVADQLRVLAERAEDTSLEKLSGDAKKAATDLSRLGEGIGRDLNRQLAGVVVGTRDTSEAWRAMLISIAESIASYSIDGLAETLIGDTKLGGFLGAGSSERPEPIRVEGIEEALAGLKTTSTEAGAAVQASLEAGTASLQAGSETAGAGLEASGLATGRAIAEGAAEAAATLTAALGTGAQDLQQVTQDGADALESASNASGTALEAGLGGAGAAIEVSSSVGGAALSAGGAAAGEAASAGGSAAGAALGAGGAEAGGAVLGGAQGGGTAITTAAATAASVLETAGSLLGGILETASTAIGASLQTGAQALQQAAFSISLAAKELLAAAIKLAAAAPAAAGTTAAVTTAGLAAKGAIFPGGLSGLVEAGRGVAQSAGVGFLTAARGAVVHRTSFAVVGEGKNSEAVVPLPDNRSIPVSFVGGGGPGGGDTYNQTYNYIDAIDVRSFEEHLQRSHRTVGGIAQQKIAQNRQMRGQVKNAAKGIG